MKRIHYIALFVVLLCLAAIRVLAQQDSLGLPPVEPGTPAANIFQILLWAGPFIVLGVTAGLRKLLPILPDWVTPLILVPLSAIGYDTIRGLFAGASSVQIALLTGAVAIALYEVKRQLSPTKRAEEKVRIAELKSNGK